MTDELIARIQLLRTPRIGPLTYRRLFFQWKNVFTILNVIKYTHDVYDKELAIQEIKDTYEQGGNFLLHDDIRYPSQLNTYNASPIITYKGNIELLKYNNLIGVIGTRKPSAQGIMFVTNIVHNLILNNCVIVSGTALGIDSEAHSINYKYTIGIIPSGLLHLNHLNINVCNNILKYGLILTDQPFNSPPQKQQFPQRNRLIAALSKSLIVIEAPIESGALITANYMLNMQKSIYIMPGRPNDIKTEGSNLFLQKNMHNPYVNILLNYENIIGLNYNICRENDINIMNIFDLNHNKNDILNIKNLITTTPINIIDLHKYSNLSIASLLSILSDLEMLGHIIVENYTVYLLH